MTRRTAALATTTILLAGGLVTVAPASACGCGGFATDGSAPVEVVDEQAVIRLADGEQRVQIAMDAVSDAPNAALVVPTPSPATAELGSRALFDQLEDLVAPQPETVALWWPETTLGWGDGAPEAGAPAPESSVEVYQEVTLGPLEVVSIGSRDLDALTTWLDERGYLLSAALEGEMAEYVEDGWSFVAIRLDPDQGALAGEVPPLELTFASETLVYPMRLSAAAVRPQQVRTYVVSDGRVDRSDQQAADAETLFAGPLGTPGSELLAEWGAPFGERAYVSASEQRFVEPWLEITDDFTWQASDEGDFHRTYRVEVYRMIGPFVAGPALVALGGVLVAVGVVVGAVVRTRRRSRAARAT